MPLTAGLPRLTVYPYTNITDLTREASTDPALTASDSLHPSGLEYKKWAELLAPKMKAVLK